MIEFDSGDLLLSAAKAIAHGVAPGDHFDSGLALALRERWPEIARWMLRLGSGASASPHP